MASFTTTKGYNPLAYGYLVQQKAIQSSAIINTGLARADAYLQSRIDAGGNIIELSDYKALTYDEPNLSDQSGSLATPDSPDSDEQKCRVSYLNKVWGVKDFAKDIVGQNPVVPITNGIGGYWANALQKRAVATLLGVQKANEAGDDDMTYDIANDANSAVGAGEQISAAAILIAKQTLGDKAKLLTHIIMPSAMYTRLQLLNLITYIPNARGEIAFSKYLEYTVIVDDESLLVTAGTYKPTYTVILAGLGALGFGNGRVNAPFATERSELVGNGGGEEFFISRMAPVFHPWGFSWEDDTVAGASPSVTELGLADNWSQVWQRKNIPLAFLKVNEALN